MLICAGCWKRPGPLLREVLWRWSFGLPAAAVLGWQGIRCWAAAGAGVSLTGLSLSDPMQAAQQLAAAFAVLVPQVEQVALWLAPLLAVAWAVASGLGRSAVLRSLDPRLHPARLTLILLQLVRIATLAAACLGWYQAILWAANATLDRPLPNLVAWSAWVICLSLGVFVLWALLSWVFSVAPLLAMAQGGGVLASLVRSLHLGPLTGKLVEVNLVLGIVRLALMVLAMVFSAIPLPFTAAMTGTPLYLWWALVTVLYLLAGDFFQVARLAALVHFWRLYHPGSGALPALAPTGKP